MTEVLLGKHPVSENSCVYGLKLSTGTTYWDRSESRSQRCRCSTSRLREKYPNNVVDLFENIHFVKCVTTRVPFESHLLSSIKIYLTGRLEFPSSMYSSTLIALLDVVTLETETGGVGKGGTRS